MYELRGKKVLITGASGGIGRAIADIFYKNGADVGIAGTKITVLEKIAKYLQQKYTDGGDIKIFAANLSNANGINEFISQIQDQFNDPIDILVNNAGITRDNLSLRMSDEEWNEVVTVNLEAPFRLIRGFVRGMMKKRWGRVINISSVVGFAGNLGQVNYCATKSGIVGMSKAFAREFATRGITINCVAPGFIESPMTATLTEERKAKLKEAIPMGEIGKPEDVAAAVLFLASDGASYITGQTIHVNGGMEMY